jgi:tetratricopeptide (TPR) repeat protein
MNHTCGILILFLILLLISAGCLNQNTTDKTGQQNQIEYEEVSLSDLYIEDTETISPDEKDSEVWLRKANILRETGRFNESLSMFEHAITLNNSSVAAWTGKADSLLELDRFNESLEVYTIALTMDPSSSVGWRGKGITLYYKGQYPEALIALNTSLHLNEHDIATWTYRGAIFSRIGSYQQAIDCYDRALTYDPDNMIINSAREEILKMNNA